MRKQPKKRLSITDFRGALNQSTLRNNIIKCFPRVEKFTCYNDSKEYNSVDVITAQVIIDRLAPIFCTDAITKRVLQFAVDSIEANGIEQYDNNEIAYRDFIIGIINAQLHIFCEKDYVFMKSNNFNPVI
jgi:hypothetical protein